MLKSFDGHVFKPHGIVPVFPVMLGRKTKNVEVEVVNAPIDYNLLLGRSWTYVMEVFPSSYFRCIKFLHEGKLVTIDQLSFCNAPNESGTTIPLVDKFDPSCENIGVGLYPSLMGSFNFTAPILSLKSLPIYAISQVAQDQEVVDQSFKTNYLSDPWTLPKLDTLVDGESMLGMASPLSIAEWLIRMYKKKLQTHVLQTWLMRRRIYIPCQF